MTRSILALLVGSLSLPLVVSVGAQAADLDDRYALPPPPPVRYERPLVVERPVVIEERPVFVERRPLYAGPYPYPQPYASGYGYRRPYFYPHRYAPYAFRPRPYGWYR